MKMKQISASVLSAVLLLGTAACTGAPAPITAPVSSGGTSSSVSASAPSAEKTITLNYWTWESSEAQKKLVEAFNKDHPEIQFNITQIARAEDYTIKVQQVVASGSELPDILIGEANQRGLLYGLDIWEDLSKAPYNADLNNYFDLLKSRCMNAKGELVGLEISMSPSAMAYRRDLTKKYFGTDDRAELEKRFSTMDDYIQAAKEVKEKSAGKDFLFHSSGWVMDEWLVPASVTSNVDSNGVLDYSGKMLDIYKNVCALRDAGGIDTLANWTPQANAAFGDGHHIFFPCPNWGIEYQIRANDTTGEPNWGLMLPPGGGYSCGGTAFGISKTSQNKEAAWTYINWGNETQNGANAYKEAFNYFVPAKKFYEDPKFASYVDPIFNNQDTGNLLYNEIVPNMTAAPISSYDSAVTDVNSLIAQSIMSDPSITAEQATAKGVEELKNKLPDATIK